MCYFLQLAQSTKQSVAFCCRKRRVTRQKKRVELFKNIKTQSINVHKLSVVFQSVVLLLYTQKKKVLTCLFVYFMSHSFNWKNVFLFNIFKIIFTLQLGLSKHFCKLSWKNTAHGIRQIRQYVRRSSFGHFSVIRLIEWINLTYIPASNFWLSHLNYFIEPSKKYIDATCHLPHLIPHPQLVREFIFNLVFSFILHVDQLPNHFKRCKQSWFDQTIFLDSPWFLLFENVSAVNKVAKIKL